MKTQYKQTKLISILAVRSGTTGDTTAIQRTVDNCKSKTAYLNTINVDGVDTQVVSIETSKGSDSFAHIALDTFVLSAISKMYPRDSVIGGRVSLDGTMLNGVMDARASAIRSILNGTEEVKTALFQVDKLDSAAFFAHCLRQAKEERVREYTEFLEAQLADVLDNPASYLADFVQSGKPVTLGKINTVGVKADDLPSFLKPFDLPLERVKSLLLSEQHRAALDAMLKELAQYKPANARIVDNRLCADCMRLSTEQQAAIIMLGYTIAVKDSTDLTNALNAAAAVQNFEAVVSLGKELMTIKDTFVVSKSI